MSGNRHSHLAMKAARRIGSAKQKGKVGRTICYHLLMMIEQEESAGQRQGEGALRGNAKRISHPGVFNHQPTYKKKQFSLGL